MRNLNETIKMAFSSIVDNKVRYILTLIGIVLGISSLIAIVSLGNGMGDSIKDSMMSGSEDRAVTLTFRPNMDDYLETKNSNPFNDSVINNINRIQGVNKVEKEFSTSTQMKIDDKDTMIGVNYSANNDKVKVKSMVDGRNFNEYEFKKPTKVCIISTGLKKKLFKDKKAIGELIQISNKPVTVIGVTKEDMPGNFMELDSIYIPKPTWNIIYGDNCANGLKISISQNYNMDKVSEQITKNLNQKTTLKGTYEIFNMKNIANSIGKVTSIITSFVASIAGISLIVGGTGVMNIMYVAIVERTREIGVRRALGATSKNILFQFLIESIVVCLIGGIIGVLFGIGIAKLIGLAIHIHAKSSLGVMALGFGISIFMGIVFGISPALKAARLNPIDALSYE